jgi:hypothetical protein
MSRTKLLLKAPPPPSRAPAYIAIALVWIVSLVASNAWTWVNAYTLSAEDRWEWAVAQEQLERCIVADGRVVRSATIAGVEILRMQKYQEEARAYADSMTHQPPPSLVAELD